MESVYDELDDVFGPSVDVESIATGMGSVTESINAAVKSLKSVMPITMRRSDLLFLDAIDRGGVTYRNYQRALRRSRRNQGGKHG